MNLQSGTKFGAYEILASIGARGRGEVYKALDTRLNRTVAIKILPEQLSSEPEAKRRFEREVQILAALNHPHICTLFDFGDQDGIQYLVMEYLEGETLAGRLQKGALPVDDALRIAVDIADALDKAHQQEVVHGNLRPANIMLTDSGAKLLDFGLGKPVQASNAPGPAVETTPGTLEYLPPESLEGIDADESVDLWSFGCVLYEMLTGKKAFGHSTLSDIPIGSCYPQVHHCRFTNCCACALPGIEMTGRNACSISRGSWNELRLPVRSTTCPST